MSFTYTQGTIKPAENLNLERQAEFLRKAMRGLGTDERRIIQILASHSNQQRQEISQKYKQMYGRDLVEDLKSELSGCFEDLVVAMLVPTRKFDAINVHKALGSGPDEITLVEILCPRTNAAMEEIKTVYKELYQKDLGEEVENKLSGEFKRVIVSQVAGSREENEDVDMEKVKKDAQDLYDAGEGQIGTDESIFIKVLCMRSFSHLKKLFEEYKIVSTVDIEETIKSETSGSLTHAFLSIVKYIKSPSDYFAERLMRTMVGIGTNDDYLIRLIVDRSELDLAEIKESYLRMYKTSLHSAIESDTSGDYRKLLLAIVNGSMSPP